VTMQGAAPDAAATQAPADVSAPAEPVQPK
jgi:hypothetical protein